MPATLMPTITRRVTGFCLLALAASAALCMPSRAADLPARPDQLKYPPLNYAAPKAADYRVTLPGGAAILRRAPTLHGGSGKTARPPRPPA